MTIGQERDRPTSAIAGTESPTRPAPLPWKGLGRAVSRWMPKGLYARSLIIIVAPIVLLQAVVAFVFMERHWQQVTARLSQTATQNIAGIIDLYEADHDAITTDQIAALALRRFGLQVSFQPAGPLPPTQPQPFFSLLERTLGEELSRQIGKPFWIDATSDSNLVEVRIQLEDANLRVRVLRSHVYASNSHIFIVWMVVASLILLAVAISFLRNQIRPILELADAAESFGKGRESSEFRPRGAREVRQAAHAFIEMRRRIERQIEQRTTMLAGVSHDLRTILTRFKLELELLEDSPDVEALRSDVDEMQNMLEEYLSFARGDAGEVPELVDVEAIVESLSTDARRSGQQVSASFSGDAMVTVKPVSLKRCLANLVDNACRYGTEARITAVRGDTWLSLIVDDNGPGVPSELRESVFRPFYRLDDARNQDRRGTGLGLSIARDVARGHGGEIQLAESPLGGLRVTVRIPV